MGQILKNRSSDELSMLSVEKLFLKKLTFKNNFKTCSRTAITILGIARWTICGFSIKILNGCVIRLIGR